MISALPRLKETKGSVINMGSGPSVQSIPRHAAYRPNKEAIRGFSRIAAKEWGAEGITVNVINPHGALAESEHCEAAHPEIIAEIMKTIALGRIGYAEPNVASLCVYLISEGGQVHDRCVLRRRRRCFHLPVRPPNHPTNQGAAHVAGHLRKEIPWNTAHSVRPACGSVSSASARLTSVPGA